MIVRLTKPSPSLIVRRMKKPLFLLVLTLFCAIPAAAQSSEFGITLGGSSRTVDDAVNENDVPFLDDELSLSRSAVDLFWGLQIEEGTWLKIKAGRIQTPVAVDVSPVQNPRPPANQRIRRDVEGEVQHIEANAEYRFSEPFGTTALFAGVGLYRHSGEGVETESNWGWNAGVNADFPITRRYGLLIEGTYHWTRADFRPRYLTIGGGLRVSF